MMKYYGKTDKGNVRNENQDCFGIYNLMPGLTLCVICDGMGGNAGGSVASRLAIDTFADAVRCRVTPDSPESVADLSDRKLRRALTVAADEANRAVIDRAAESNGKLDGMGTTVVGVLIAEGGPAYSVNVGDSRLYLIDDSRILQLTRDHSLVQQLVDQGRLTYEEARASDIRNIITRAIGIDLTMEADVSAIDLPDEGGWLLLCSDGLSGVVREDRIKSEFVPGRDSRDIAEALVMAADEAGSPDNVTVIVVSF